MMGMTLSEHVGMELQSQEDAATRALRFKSALLDLAQLQLILEKLPSYAHIGNFGVGTSYSEESRAEVRVYLSSEHKDSPLARELAQALGVNGKKSPGWAGDSLNVSYTWRGVLIEVSNYLPQTCTVVEEEVDVPAHKKKVRKVICSNGEEGV